jgi:glucan phosphoethanolaminetransferase (alkaline phosphatase superfamily)
MLKETVENLRNEPGFNLLVDKRGDNFTFLLRIVQVLLAAGIAYKFILPHLKDFYYALTNRQKTDAEKYEEIKQIIEENQRYRMNSDRSAQALLQLQAMMQPQTNISGLSKSMWGI